MISMQQFHIYNQLENKSMAANKQIIKINKSILDYFMMQMGFDNESTMYRKATITEFKEELLKSLNVKKDNMEIEWVENS